MVDSVESQERLGQRGSLGGRTDDDLSSACFWSSCFRCAWQTPRPLYLKLSILARLDTTVESVGVGGSECTGVLICESNGDSDAGDIGRAIAPFSRSRSFEGMEEGGGSGVHQ